MFIDQRTHQVSLPREKPLRLIIEERPMTYTNIVGDDEMVKTTAGREIVREINVRDEDTTKAMRIAMLPTPLGNKALASLAEGRFDHARRCKKSPSECLLCQANMTWFASLPPLALSYVLNEGRFR